MKNTLVLSTTAQVLAAAPYPLTVLRISGTCTGANCWLQVFDFEGNITPATNDVPLYSIQVFGGPDGFMFGGLELNCTKGLYIALSDTDRAYTAAAASTMTLQVDVEQVTVLSPTATGSLTATNRSTLQVYSEATGATTLSKLYDVFVKNPSGAAAWLMVFTTDSSSDGDEALAAFPLSSAATIQKVSFGPNGQYFVGLTKANVATKGLTLRLSSTGTSLTGISATNGRMLAYSKTS